MNEGLYILRHCVLILRGSYAFGCIRLSVCVCDNSKSYKQIFLNFLMWLGPDPIKKCLHFGKDTDHILD